MGRLHDAMARGALVLLVVLAAGACDQLPAQPIRTPAGEPVGPGKVFEPGPRDVAFQRLDPEAILRGVEGGAQCRLIGPFGAGGGDGFSMVRGFECPPDRNLWFAFADAWEDALLEIAESPGGGSELGEAPSPLEEHWQLRGDEMTGTSRVIGTHGLGGKLQIFVSLDLYAP